MPQWKPRAGASTAEDRGRPEHDGISATGHRLGDVAALGHAAVGDHVAVDACLVEVAHPGAGHIGDGRGLGNAKPKHAGGSEALPGPTPTRTPTAPVRSGGGRPEDA